jgi:hypothetical protein
LALAIRIALALPVAAAILAYIDTVIPIAWVFVGDFIHAAAFAYAIAGRRALTFPAGASQSAFYIARNMVAVLI